MSALTLQQLSDCESRIERNLQGFYEVGKALAEIRDNKLYHIDRGGDYETFEKYVKERWGWERQRAYELIKASDAMGDVINLLHPPTTDSQARELSKLETPDDRREAWQEAVETAPNGKVTAAHVREVVNKRTGEVMDPDDVELVKVHPVKAVKVERDDGRQSSGGMEELAGSNFGCIYADPPWQYGNQGTRAATDNHYPTMPLDEICALPVGDIAAENAHLHLWTTNAFLFDARQVMEAWGFTYKSLMLWVKPQMGIGNYWRVSHELLLFGVRGSAPFRDRGIKSWVQADRTGHSQKPEVFRQLIERVSPGPYVELFARKASHGWTAWGNQIESCLYTGAKE